jgi:hypothetical protein
MGRPRSFNPFIGTIVVASKELPMRTAGKLVLVSLLVGLSAILAVPGAATAANVVIRLNGTQVSPSTLSCPTTTVGCSIPIAGTYSISTGRITITNRSSTDLARVQLTAGSSTFFAKLTGAVMRASSPTGALSGTIPSPGLTLEVSLTNTSGNFGTYSPGGTKAFACALSGFWNRSIASSGDNSVTQTCSALNNAGSFASINSILSFVTLTSSATSFAPTQETLSQACGSSATSCRPAMNVVFRAKFTRFGDTATVPTSADAGGSAFNVDDQGLLDLNIAQNKPGIVTWPVVETVRVNFTQPDHDRPQPPGPNIPLKVERQQACSAFDSPPANCPPPSTQTFMMVSDPSNNSFGADENTDPPTPPLPWVLSDDRSFVGTPFSGKVSDITVLKAQGLFTSQEGQGSLYFSLKGPGRKELIRIHLGDAPSFTQNYADGPTNISTVENPPPCGGQSVIGLNEPRYEIVETGEFVTYNQLGNLKNQRLESVSLVLAPFQSLRQVFELGCFELATRTTVVQFIPFQNESFVPTCAIESEPGRAKVLVTRDGDPDFFRLIDMTAKPCRWEGAVAIASGQPGTYTFTFILDDQPKPLTMDVVFGGS